MTALLRSALVAASGQWLGKQRKCLISQKGDGLKLILGPPDDEAVAGRGAIAGACADEDPAYGGLSEASTFVAGTPAGLGTAPFDTGLLYRVSKSRSVANSCTSPASLTP